MLAGKKYGQVKWFNTKTGYGFLTDLESKEDVFVHHSGLKLQDNKKNKIYKILYQGEYVEFRIDKTTNNDKNVAVDVTGILNGLLMCEVRNNEFKNKKK